MAKGITQAQVDTAADALVVAGERPTVDRIRAFLGTGSPNTVTRMLEAWWQSLGSRLAAQQARVALPDVPEPVAVVATQLWDVALRMAQEEATRGCLTQMDAIGALTSQLEFDRQALDERAAALTEATRAADQARLLAEARLIEALQLVQHQSAQIDDMTQERNAARTRLVALELDRAALSERLGRVVDDASAERDALIQHARGVEDRALQEIDRARQDAKTLQAQLTKREKEWRQTERQLIEIRDQATRDTASHQRQAATQRARADALEQQLHRLQETAVRIAPRSSSSRPRRTKVTKPKGTS